MFSWGKEGRWSFSNEKIFLTGSLTLKGLDLERWWPWPCLGWCTCMRRYAVDSGLGGGAWKCVISLWVDGVSCEERDGPSERSIARNTCIGRAWLLCACGNVALTHLSGQSAIHNLPTCTCRASHLKIEEMWKYKSRGKWNLTSNTHFNVSYIWLISMWRLQLQDVQ